MPCYTKVQLFNTDKDKYTVMAKAKLGIGEKEQVTQAQLGQIKIEAGKLKTAALIKIMNPAAMIKGLQVGIKELNIQLDL